MSAEKFCDQEEWCGFVHAGTVHRLMDAYAASEVKRVAGPLINELFRLQDIVAQCDACYPEVKLIDAALAAARAELEGKK